MTIYEQPDKHDPPGGFDLLGFPMQEGNPNPNGFQKFYPGWDLPPTSNGIPACLRKGDSGETPGCIPDSAGRCLYCGEMT